MRTGLSRFLRNAALLLLVALPAWLFLQFLLFLTIIHTPGESMPPPFEDGLFLYMIAVGPLAAGALLHYAVLDGLVRFIGRVSRITAAMLVPLMVLPWLAIGISPGFFGIWHSTISLSLALIGYSLLMVLPPPRDREAPA
jgi:hypothetical protein